jgi:hypothetical protein
MQIRKAERKKSKLRLGLCGPSGVGKTRGALEIAKGLGGNIIMIDTEHGSGELYVHICPFDVISLAAPYSPQRYVEAIKMAEKGGYTTLIIDSLSHAWAGEGGVLEMADKAAKASRSGNSYTAWRDVTPHHNKLVEAILSSPLHIIVTMRTKTEYAMEINEKGKTAPKKVGLAPIQREGMEYEFTVVLDISHDGHVASASKDRTELFDGKPDVITTKTGKMLLEWLNSGKEELEAAANVPVVDIEDLSLADICNNLIEELRVPEAKISKFLENANVFSVNELPEAPLQKLHNWLLTKKAETQNAAAA